MRTYLALTLVAASLTVVLAHSVESVVALHFNAVIHALQATQAAQATYPTLALPKGHAMTAVQALAYLTAALAFSMPTVRAVYYIVEMTKSSISWSTNAATQNNQTRLYAAALGAVILPFVAWASSLTGIAPAFDIRVLPFEVLAGVAAGLGAIMDWHFEKALQEVASSGDILGALADLSGEGAPPAEPTESAPVIPPAATPTTGSMLANVTPAPPATPAAAPTA